MYILIGALVLVGIVVIAVVIVQMGSRGLKRAKALTPEAIATLDKLKPKLERLRAEMTHGARENPDELKGAGALALYKDEVVFAGKGPAWRMPLADLTDMTEIRALTALEMGEDFVDTAPDYMLKLTWKGGSATFAVHDATGWISSIAGARM